VENEYKGDFNRDFWQPFYRVRNKVRRDKGLAPIEPEQRGGLPPPAAEQTVLEGEIVPNVDEDAVYPEVADWQRCMRCLTDFEPVFTWALDWEPGLMRGLLKLEHECLTAASNSHPQEYGRCKDSYLSILGKIYRLYWVRHVGTTSYDFTALALGGQKCRIENDPTAPIPDDVLVIQTHEFPQFLCTPPHTLKQLLTARLAFPGSRVR